MNEELGEELVAMHAEDLRVRPSGRQRSEMATEDPEG